MDSGPPAVAPEADLPLPLAGRLAAHGLDRRAFLLRAAGSAVALSGASTLLAACGGSGGGATGSATGAATPTGGTPPASPVGTLGAAIPADILTLDPAQALNAQDLSVIGNVYEGLLAWDKTFEELVPSLAVSYEESPDGLEWVFRLREGVTFQDGTPFNAKAVKASFDYYLSNPAYLGPLLLPESPKEVDASDPNVLRMKLAEPYPDLARNQTFVKIISPKLIAAGSEAVGKNPTGTGAYRFESYKAGQTVQLTANDDHWGKAGPHFERLSMPVIEQLSSRISAVSTGEVDAVNRLPPPQVEQLSGNGDLSLPSTKSWAAGYLVMHTTSGPLTDPRVRQAIAYAVDREAIVKNILLDKAEVAASTLPPGVYGFAKPKTQYSYSPSKAEELLSDAGVTNPTVRIAAAQGVHVLGEEIAQAVAAQLQAVGFDARSDTIENTIFQEETADPDAPHDIFFNEYFWLNGGPLQLSLDFPKTYSMWAPAEYEKLRDEMLVTPDGQKRLKQLAGIQELIAQQVPWLPMHVQVLTDALQADIHGYVVSKGGLIPEYGPTFRV